MSGRGPQPSPVRGQGRLGPEGAARATCKQREASEGQNRTSPLSPDSQKNSSGFFAPFISLDLQKGFQGAPRGALPCLSLPPLPPPFLIFFYFIINLNAIKTESAKIKSDAGVFEVPIRGSAGTLGRVPPGWAGPCGLRTVSGAGGSGHPCPFRCSAGAWLQRAAGEPREKGDRGWERGKQWVLSPDPESP